MVDEKVSRMSAACVLPNLGSMPMVIACGLWSSQMCKLANKCSVSLYVLVKQSTRRGVASRLGLNEQASGKMFTSVCMNRYVVDLVWDLGGASVVGFSAED